MDGLDRSLRHFDIVLEHRSEASRAAHAANSAWAAAENAAAEASMLAYRNPTSKNRHAATVARKSAAVARLELEKAEAARDALARLVDAIMIEHGEPTVTAESQITDRTSAAEIRCAKC